MPYPIEPQKWVFLLSYLFLGMISNWAVLSYIHDFVPRGGLPDVLHLLLPEQEWASWCADYMVSCCLTCGFILVFFHEGRVVIARRTVLIVATLYLMRSITLMLTQLPPAYENNQMRCREQINVTREIFVERFDNQLVNLGFQEKEGMLCGDLLFSGHTLLMVSIALTISYYLPKGYKWLQWIPNTMVFFGAICLVISRTHYTIDVVIAYWLTTYVFRIYHAYCEADIIMIREDSILQGVWWIRIVDWLEERIVPGRINNTFRLPLVDSVLHRYNSSIPHVKFESKATSQFSLA